jgi:cytochrome c-type biogenesis protein
MLGVAFSLAADDMLYGASLLLAYGLGHCAVIVLAGTSTEVIQSYLDWNEKSKGAVALKKICGILVIVGGVWLVYTAP